MAKKRKMTVSQQRPFDWSPQEGEKWVYRVAEVDDSVLPHLGHLLTPEELAAYCDDESWNVRIRFMERV